ncbi:MAG TPA: choice-of-anchor tandem repeat GloVer-containing protein [Terriglobia bacterium]|nr:choice-of-anchor tandem repeat GloVer-containing protein [Terriglobia bacterium]
MDGLNWVKTTFGLFLLCATMAITLPAQTFTTLHSFDNTDGNGPSAALVQATDGNLYGTTLAGGDSTACQNGCGTVFKITPSGTLTTLYNFGDPGGTSPYGGLVQGTDGNFYGTTFYGGAQGLGMVFKITPGGTLTTLYSFCSQSGCADGSAPLVGLVQATNGNFYGTTSSGGTSASCPPFGCGTVFRITPGGALTTLHNFDLTDGEYPAAGLVQATNGNLYGTTAFGGTNNSGTVFKISPSGTLTTLYSFCIQGGFCTDGAVPVRALVQATDKNFYGTTQNGGGGNNGGTVFKITSSGTLTTLYSFCSLSGCADGESPEALLVQATNGNFYGTTYGGGDHNSGTVFKITSTGVLTTLYTFCSQSGCPDGQQPFGGLVQDTNGNFYGTTQSGGAKGGYGTVFSLSVDLGPFVETQTTSGKVGATVKILGTNLTGATNVTFNGTSTTFTVLSSSLIKTTVPAGATTGKVQVVTPSGTLSSNVPFRVLP